MTKRKRQDKPLTPHQAWLVTSIMFGYRAGICWTLSELMRVRLSSPSTHDKMCKQLETKRPRNEKGYWWPLGNECDKARVEVALKLAKAAKR